MAAEQDRFEDVPGDICREKHPTAWWITCQLEPDHLGEHVRECAPVEVGERLMFSQYTVHWQDPCECESHTGVGDDLWKCDTCGEVIRYVDDPEGKVTLTELHPYRNRRVRVEMVTPGERADSSFLRDDQGEHSEIELPVCDECGERVQVDCILAEPSSPESVAAISAILLAAHKRLAHSDMPAHYHYAWPHGETCTNPTCPPWLAQVLPDGRCSDMRCEHCRSDRGAQ